jgi:hypothetical protein
MVGSQTGQIVHEIPYLKKYRSQKRAGGVTQAVVHLPSKHEILSSNPLLTKK